MDIDKDHASDCESDKDYCVDSETLGPISSDESASEESDKDPEKNLYLNSKKQSVKDRKSLTLRKTRQSEFAENFPSTTDKDELHSDEEAEKSRSAAMYADFLSDVGSDSRINHETVHNRNNAENANRKLNHIPNKSDKQVAIHLKNPMEVEKTENSTISASRLCALKRPLNKGVAGSLISKLEKKRKFSVLEKSQMDWKNFKRVEGIDEQLRTHNKGKDGYLERQEFLQRTDFRQFEIEKNLRQSRRTN